MKTFIDKVRILWKLVEGEDHWKRQALLQASPGPSPEQDSGQGGHLHSDPCTPGQ